MENEHEKITSIVHLRLVDVEQRLRLKRLISAPISYF